MYKICLVCGGDSLESEISVLSALKVYKVIKQSDYEEMLVYQDKEGNFFDCSKVTDIKSFVRLKKVRRGSFFSSPNKHYFQVGLKKSYFDYVWPIVHGKNTEDGSMKAFFDTLKIPTIGNSLSASALIQDKDFFKRWAKANNIPTLKHYVITANEYKRLSTYLKPNYSFPLIVKPAQLGSSIGVRRVDDEEGLASSLAEVFKYDDKAIVEEFCQDLLELNVALIKTNKGILNSKVDVTNSEDRVLTFEDKYLDNKKIKDEDTDSSIIIKVNEYATKVYELLSLSGPVRFDYLYSRKTKKLYMNEVNIIPGSLSLDLFYASSISPLLVIKSSIEEGIRLCSIRSRLVKEYNESSFEKLIEGMSYKL